MPGFDPLTTLGLGSSPCRSERTYPLSADTVRHYRALCQCKLIPRRGCAVVSHIPGVAVPARWGPAGPRLRIVREGAPVPGLCDKHLRVLENPGFPRVGAAQGELTRSSKCVAVLLARCKKKKNPAVGPCARFQLLYQLYSSQINTLHPINFYIQNMIHI